MKTYTHTTQKPLLKIFQDTTESPRNWTNIGHMICYMKNYNSPDTYKNFLSLLTQSHHGSKNADQHKERFKKLIEEQGEEVVFIETISKYEHGQVSFSLGEMNCWDSGVVGFYVVTKDSLKEFYGEEPITKERIREHIQNEISIYNQWINGEVYGFTLYEEQGECIDCCGGFYNIEDIKEHLPKEWENEELTEYIVYD